MLLERNASRNLDKSGLAFATAHCLMAAPYRACIRYRSLFDGCALAGVHSVPLVVCWLRLIGVPLATAQCLIAAPYRPCSLYSSLDANCQGPDLQNSGR